MSHDDVHELAAAYVLDALAEDERHSFEAHLDECSDCRAEVAELGEAAAALAYVAEGPAPPSELRGRILAAARVEPPEVVALGWRRRRLAAGAALAAAACAALALGLWAALSGDGPGPQRVALAGARGELVVRSSGEAQLTVEDLPAAPVGKAYEVWVIEAGKPLPAGLFSGADDRDVVQLERPVPAGATVAVTLEPGAGSKTPTGDVLFSARLSA